MAFGRFDIASLLRLGFELGGAYFLYLHIQFHAEPLVFLFLEQNAFQPLGVFGRQLNVAQDHFFDDHGVGREFLRDGRCGRPPDLVALGGE